MLEELKSRGENILQDETKLADKELLSVELLIPFMEYVLGYSVKNPGEIIRFPSYSKGGDYTIDFGLAGEYESIYKSCVKIVPYNSTPQEDEIDQIKSALDPINVDYVVITDCINYTVYTYNSVDRELSELGKFSLVKDDINKDLIKEIKAPPNLTEKQRLAYREGEESNDVYEIDEADQSDIETTDSTQPKHLVQPDTTEKDKKVVRINKKLLALLVIAFLLVSTALGMFAISARNAQPGTNSFSVFNLIRGVTLDKYELSGTIALEYEQEDVLVVQFYSQEIPAGAIITFDIINGERFAQEVGILNESGVANLSFEIPANWDAPEIAVTAALFFDRPVNPQPVVVTNKYGDTGEKIIGKENAPTRFHISFTSIEYDSEAVRLRKEREELLRQAEEEQKRKELFSQLEIRVDMFGNWKVLPKGFDMHSVNIAESRNVYPQIYFDNEQQEVYFTLICGVINSMQIIRFTSVIFFADGFQWEHPVSSNQKEISVSGGIAKEWVYYNNFNVPQIVSDTELLARSAMSKVTFRGDKVIERTLSDREKKNLLLMIEAYEDYFNTGDAPDPDWIG